MFKRAGRYSEAEVRSLIEGYAELKARVDTTRPGLRYLVALADLDKTMQRLSRRKQEVILLHGFVGLTSAQAAQELHVSHRAVLKRYHHALEEVVYLINGGV